VCCGAAEGMKLVAAALARAGTSALAIEAFGLASARESLARAGLRCPPLTVDSLGADVMALNDMPEVGGVVLTPSHQFPIGTRLSSDRRAAVIDWARRTGGVILEDDDDGEFRHDRRPVGALHGVDPGHVIYMGTVSKSLAPGLRLGWLVVPDYLVRAVAGQKGETEETSGFVDQLTMAEFIRSGSYDRHIRTMRRQYGRRREQLVAAVTQIITGNYDHRDARWAACDARARRRQREGGRSTTRMATTRRRKSRSVSSSRRRHRPRRAGGRLCRARPERVDGRAGGTHPTVAMTVKTNSPNSPSSGGPR
jgi:DNA-binding transcriptional MocR family regulator